MAPRRLLMERARDELLADPALTADQHGHVAVADLLDDGGDAAHAVTAAPDRLVFVVVELLPQLAQLGHEPVLLDRVLDGDIEGDLSKPLRVVGLHHVVGRAGLDGLDDRRGVIAAREHDDLRVRMRGLDGTQGRHAVEPRHHDVEQHGVGHLTVFHRGQQLVSTAETARFVAAQRQERSQSKRRMPGHRPRLRHRVSTPLRVIRCRERWSGWLADRPRWSVTWPRLIQNAYLINVPRPAVIEIGRK